MVNKSFYSKTGAGIPPHGNVELVETLLCANAVISLWRITNKETDFTVTIADIPLRLYAKLVQQLQDKKLLTLFQEVAMPLIEVLAELEYNGISVNVELLKTLIVRFASLLDELTS